MAKVGLGEQGRRGDLACPCIDSQQGLILGAHFMYVKTVMKQGCACLKYKLFMAGLLMCQLAG